jgi:phage shock protein A
MNRALTQVTQSRATSSSVDTDLAKTLAERAKKAEALVTTLKEELTESENVQSKLNLKLERMQNQIDMLNGVKQVRSSLACLYHR